MPKNSPSLSKAHFDGAIAIIRREIRDQVKGSHDRFNSLDKRFDSVDLQLIDAHTKLDAILSLDVIATRKQLLSLMRALRLKGIELDEAEILAA